jgi:drug/metabolite transporter (DMT)-like permease
MYMVLATMIWGVSFVAQSVGMESIGPLTFQTFRCLLAFLFLSMMLFCIAPGKFLQRWNNKKLWFSGGLAGVALFIAGNLQQIGIMYTSAGKAGFLTAMYIVMVPVIGRILGSRINKNVIISIFIAIAGLYMLSCAGVTDINIGDISLLGGAFFYSIQITIIDRTAGGQDGIEFNCIQSLVAAVLTAVCMFLFEEPKVDSILVCWLPLAYTGVLSMGVAFTLQIKCQQCLEPTTASLLMSLESVFAALAGWLILHERMTGAELLGCLLLFCAVIISQLPVKEKAKQQK